MKRVLIKICGVTNRPDAEACAELGADMIGLNFWHDSPRYLLPGRARAISEALPRQVEAVGIFVDGTATQIRRCAQAAAVSSIQLHGAMPAATCRELAREFRVIRALRTHPLYIPEEALAFSGCDILLDADETQMQGGTGNLCDWSAACATAAVVRFLILAGGLNAENVGQAIKIVAPDAVDVCSGVEKGPGVKSHEAIAAFIEAVRNVETTASARTR